MNRNAKAGKGNNPANYVPFFDALRYANWLNNGKYGADTEVGAYTLNGSNSRGVVRNECAQIFARRCRSFPLAPVCAVAVKA